MNKKFILKIVAALVVVGVISYFAYGSYRENKSKEMVANAKTVTVERRNMRTIIEATGTIAPVDYVDVAPKKTGRITSVLVKENEAVHRGQLVATLDSEELETKKEKAAIDVRDKESKYNRVKYLYTIGAKSQEELETAKFNYDTAVTTLASAQADINDTLIYASMDGVVVGEPQTVGAMATQGTNNPTVIMRIADLSKKQILAKIDESDIGDIKVGQEAEFTVDAYKNETFKAKVSKISQTDTANLWNIKGSSSSSSSSSNAVIYYYVTLDVEDPESKLFPAMTARVTVLKDVRKNALAIPIASVKADGEGAYVMIKEDNGRITRRAVQLGISDDDYVEVVSGLSEGDKIFQSYQTAEVIKTERRDEAARLNKKDSSSKGKKNAN
ncbi:MAG: efflux RND transporter periplasmic adaptor subunit [Selenomonadaceae bacterium]|nr:efflux RND transporter periplasmic adaptor subunit [Selenomonadaceae bacterium]